MKAAANAPPRAVHGWRRALFLARLKAAVLLHYLPELRSLGPRRFALLLRRLLFFLSKLDHNKFVRCNGGTRLDLYLPSFPGPAFYHACDKLKTFDGPLPCMTVLVSLTSACRYSCQHCYQKFDLGRDVSLDLLLPVIRKLQDRGVAFFNLEGGDPFLVYERLRQVCAAIDRRSEVWVNSTGDGITPERLRELKALNLSAIMFSLHTPDPERLNAFMGKPTAWETMSRAVALCHDAGVPVAFNTCAGPEAFGNGEFDRLMRCARDFGACLVQLIKPKPAGAWLSSPPPEFSSADFARLYEVVNRYNHDPGFADFPAISAQVIEEDRDHFGCTAGGVDRFYINAKGDVQPCEFLNISFGNLGRESFDAIFARMRNRFDPPGESWLCEGCAHHVRQVAQSKPRLNLPLSEEDSEVITAKWDRGQPTRAYERIHRLR